MRGEAAVIGLRFIKSLTSMRESVEWVQIGSAESVLEECSGVILLLINSVAFMKSDQESTGLGSADIVCKR